MQLSRTGQQQYQPPLFNQFCSASATSFTSVEPTTYPLLGRWCFSRVAERADVIALGEWQQRISLSVLGVRNDVGVGAETG